MWAHSRSKVSGRRHGLTDHLRSTSALARQFAEPFGAGDLAAAAGLLHDAGKASCIWQEKLLAVEDTERAVGCDHKKLGARLLVGSDPRAAMTILGHHGGLTDMEHLRDARDQPVLDEAETLARFYQQVPEARDILTGSTLMPEGWRHDRLLQEMGVRMIFSALVDADHLDTAAHFQGRDTPQLAPPSDMTELVRRFEEQRRALLADPNRQRSPIDEVRTELYDTVVRRAAGPGGIYRLPAPTGSGKTITSAGFALHHAARHNKARVIVAVPFLTITEQNAGVYRRLLGEQTVLEHHSQSEFDGNDEGQLRLAAENWDAPFIVTTTVQLFDSLFGRKPARSRKLHRLTNAVLVLDEVQALPVPLLVPILDALKLLSEHFGTTVLLTSATQPSFEELSVWSGRPPRELVDEPVDLFQRLRRVHYEWWVEPRPELAEVADKIAEERQALVVVNTVDHARRMFRLLEERADVPVRHLSTRMCPAHRRAVLEEVRHLLAEDKPILLVSTQLIEAGVDVDFPVVFRALAPAESLQQAAGRANREGRRDQPGRVVVFDASDTSMPTFYRTAVGSTRVFFGPDRADPDDVTCLNGYYRHLYSSVDPDQEKRAKTIQERRTKLDFLSVAEGPLCDTGLSAQRDSKLAFRMIDDDTVPVAVTGYLDTAPEVEALLAKLRTSEAPRRETFRALRPFLVTIPRRVVTNPTFAAMCQPVIGELWEWHGDYDKYLGIDDSAIGEENVW